MGITEQRLDLILDELRRDGRVNVKELAVRLDISTETVRRDLRDLEMRGEARRIYGGAVTDRKEGDQPFDQRLRVSAREKARIAVAAMALVEDGMTLFVDAGTTTLAFARQLLGRRVRIHTNSVAIATVLAADPGACVVMLGGEMRPGYRGVFGAQTLAGLRAERYDLAVMGAVTVHLEHGFMDLGREEAALRQAAVEQSRSSAMLVDSSKFGRLGTIHTFGLAAVDAVVTNAPPSAEFRAAFQRAEVKLIHA